MHKYLRVLAIFFLTLFTLIFILSFACIVLITSPKGSKLILGWYLHKYAALARIKVNTYTGNLQKGYVLKDVELSNFYFNKKLEVRVQEIDLHFNLRHFQDLDVDVFNARVVVDSNDPIVFTGHMHNGRILGNLYTKFFDVHELALLYPKQIIEAGVQGVLTNVDFKIQGELSQIAFIGSFLIEEMRYRNIDLKNNSVAINIQLEPIFKVKRVMGELLLNNGFVVVRNIPLQIEPSKVIFLGNIKNPMVDIHLGAKVEDMDFHLTINGLLRTALMRVTADPPMPPQDALAVLFTGNAWSSLEEPWRAHNSTELAQHFFDYSLQDKMDGGLFGVKTKLTDKLKLGLQMRQLSPRSGSLGSYYSRKIDGELDVSEHMSLNISQEMGHQLKDTVQSSTGQHTQDETQIYVQYKKRF